MCENIYQSDQRPVSGYEMQHQRVDAAAAVSFKHDGLKTRLDRLYQQGSAKIRFPKHHAGAMEAVLINTAGGLTGGDRLSWDIGLARGCDVAITTQACEKSYKSSSGNAAVQTSIKLGADSKLHWLPQETILYDGSSLSRRFDVEIGAGAELLALECLVFGREAMGEQIDALFFHDRWRIRRQGKLVFADDLHAEGVPGSLAGMGRNRAVASLLFVGPQDNEHLTAIVQRLRKACPSGSAGFSAFDGKITGRVLARSSYELRQAIIPVLNCLRGESLPRVWRI